MQIQTTEDQKNKLREALRQPNAAWNEVIWTYLIADVIVSGEDFGRRLCGDLSYQRASDPWIEAMPIPPRLEEGNSRIDLALGSIRRRMPTSGGIEFDGTRAPSWVGFVEAKLLSDCSTDVSNDPTRNQITRVIENLLCFQSPDGMPERLHFTLLTPRYFWEERRRRSRLYGYKFEEYSRDRQRIIEDIELTPLARRARGWSYPSLAQRVERLELHWVAYEDILDCDADLRGLDIMQCVRVGALPDAVTARLHESLREEA